MQSTRQAIRTLPSRTVRSARCGTFDHQKPFTFHHAALRPTPTCSFKQPTNHPQTRPFTLSPTLNKKGNKATRDTSSSRFDPAPSSSSSSSSSSNDDPTDFTTLESDISKTLDRLRHDLSTLRPGGRFNPTTLETLRVLLPKTPTSAAAETARLSDLATVIPKSARVIHILVSEPQFLKPISSAILSAKNLNLTPVPDPSGEDPLLLVLNIPTATTENRKEVLREAERAGEVAREGVRQARAGQQKKIRAAEKAKSVRPDEIKKVGERMEKVVEKGVGEVKKILEVARKVLEG